MVQLGRDQLVFGNCPDLFAGASPWANLATIPDTRGFGLCLLPFRASAGLKAILSPREAEARDIGKMKAHIGCFAIVDGGKSLITPHQRAFVDPATLPTTRQGWLQTHFSYVQYIDLGSPISLPRTSAPHWTHLRYPDRYGSAWER